MSAPRDVAAGVIRREGRLLVQARPDPGRWQGYWEFPGGGREPGESFDDCVRRECVEEVGLEVRVLERLDEVVWQPEGHGGVRVVFFLCEVPDGESPRSCLGQELRWATPQELAELQMLPANAAVVERLAGA